MTKENKNGEEQISCSPSLEQFWLGKPSRRLAISSSVSQFCLFFMDENHDFMFSFSSDFAFRRAKSFQALVVKHCAFFVSAGILELYLGRISYPDFIFSRCRSKRTAHRHLQFGHYVCFTSWINHSITHAHNCRSNWCSNDRQVLRPPRPSW